MNEKLKAFFNKIKPFLFIGLFPMLLFYYEAVFKISTAGKFFEASTWLLLLGSIVFGSILYLLITILKNPKIIRIITAVFMFLNAVLFLVEYFVFRQFQIYYDVNTVFAGASDAIAGFYKDIFRLIFSFDGLLKLFLYLLPPVLFLVFSKKTHRNMLANAVKRMASASLMVLSVLILLILCFTAVVNPAFLSKEYNFQASVNRFGLLSGLGLDVYNLAFKQEEGFEATDAILPTIVPTNIPLATEPLKTTTPSATVSPTPKVYGYNKMELNLSGGQGRIKDLNSYVSSLTATKKNDYTGIFKEKNLIFITAEAFSAELINPEINPTLYRLATKGIQFLDYYQPSSAGTTGGEYQNVFGMIATAGGKSFKNTANNLNYFTMGSQLNRAGYYGKAYHNNSYTYYDRNITHNNLGYSDGFMGKGNGMEQYVKSLWPQSDYEMIAGTLPTYIDKQPFNVYYMSVSGHSGYSRTGNSMTNRNWDIVKDLPYSDEVKGYFAANYELEKALAHLVSELENKGIADDTVICISTDHFPYGLQGSGKLGEMPALSELYGKEVNDIFTRDHNRLILWCGSLEKEEPIVVPSPTFSLDILPTLSNLFGLEFDSRLFVGRDVFSEAPALVFTSGYDWKTDYGTYTGGKFTPKDPAVELPQNYVDSIKTIVRNKMKYCSWCLDNDYFRYLFG